MSATEGFGPSSFQAYSLLIPVDQRRQWLKMPAYAHARTGIGVYNANLNAIKNKCSGNPYTCHRRVGEQ